MVLVVFLSAALLLLSTTLIDVVRGDSSRSARGVTRDAAFQAAEAGINDYTSKLVDDNQYYLHDVALGESTRQASGGQLVARVVEPDGLDLRNDLDLPEREEPLATTEQRLRIQRSGHGADQHRADRRHHRDRKEAEQHRAVSHPRGAD